MVPALLRTELRPSDPAVPFRQRASSSRLCCHCSPASRPTHTLRGVSQRAKGRIPLSCPYPHCLPDLAATLPFFWALCLLCFSTLTKQNSLFTTFSTSGIHEGTSLSLWKKNLKYKSFCYPVFLKYAQYFTIVAFHEFQKTPVFFVNDFQLCSV